MSTRVDAHRAPASFIVFLMLVASCWPGAARAVDAVEAAPTSAAATSSAAAPAAPSPAAAQRDEKHAVPGSLPKGDWELRFALGIGSGTPPDDLGLDAVFALNWAITDRLQWALPLPAFSYRFGEAGEADLTLRGGLVGLGYSSFDELIGRVDAGITGQLWLSPELRAIAYGSSQWEFDTATEQPLEPARSDLLLVRGSLGLSWHPADILTVSLGVGWLGELTVRDSALPPEPRSELTFGALQGVGYRPLPLVELHLSDSFSLDAYAAWSISLRDEPIRQHYLLGFGWIF